MRRQEAKKKKKKKWAVGVGPDLGMATPGSIWISALNRPPMLLLRLNPCASRSILALSLPPGRPLLLSELMLSWCGLVGESGGMRIYRRSRRNREDEEGVSCGRYGRTCPSLSAAFYLVYCLPAYLNESFNFIDSTTLFV